MKNFGAILMVLAAGASFGAALPAPNAEHGLVARGQPYYALHVREPKDGKKGKNNGQDNANANNGTLVANPNNGTANGNDNNDNGKENGNNDKGDGQDNAGDSLLETLLGLLNGAAGGQGADNVGAKAQNNPLAILEALLNAN